MSSNTEYLELQDFVARKSDDHYAQELGNLVKSGSDKVIIKPDLLCSQTYPQI